MKCSFPGCEREIEGRQELCRSHYMQRWRGAPLTPLQPYGQQGCRFPGCDNPHESHGLCGAHANQKRKGKRLHELPPTRRRNNWPDEFRFWIQVTIPVNRERCWIWNGPRLGFGHGTFGGTTAHRFAWQWENGPIPDGMFVCHRCDNPPCCNPAHLFLGTHSDNMRDMRKKNRGAQGLTPSDVTAIRQSDELGTVLAARYGVSGTTISVIRRGKTWQHV